jgi:hypothetical protein
MSNRSFSPSSFGESSGDEELVLIFVGKDVEDKSVSKINNIKTKCSFLTFFFVSFH